MSFLGSRFDPSIYMSAGSSTSWYATIVPASAHSWSALRSSITCYVGLPLICLSISYMVSRLITCCFYCWPTGGGGPTAIRYACASWSGVFLGKTCRSIPCSIPCVRAVIGCMNASRSDSSASSRMRTIWKKMPWSASRPASICPRSSKFMLGCLVSLMILLWR